MREDDADLLRRYTQECAQDAFTELVRRNMDAVYSAALRRVGGDTHLAQDVAQEVFVILARRTSELVNHPVLSGWLYTTTRNVAANLIRREYRRKFREQKDQAVHEPYFSEQQHETDWLQVSPVLDEAIDELTENDRLAVLLRYFDRQTFAEIGSVLHLSEDAARMRLARALERLRAALARRRITSSAAAVGLLLTRHTVSAAPAGLAISAAGEALALAPGLSVTATQSAFILSFPVILSLAAFVGAMLTFTWVSRTAWYEKDALAAADAKLADTSSRFREAVRHTSAQERSREHLRIAVRQSENKVSPALPTHVIVAPVFHSAEAVNKPTARLAGGRRAVLTATYHSLYRTWGLTPAQIQDFERVAVNASSDAVWVFDTSSANAASVQTAVTPSRADIERQIQALLGSERYAQYQEFNRNAAAQAVAVRLASATYLTDAVTSAKAQEMISLLGSNSAVHGGGGAMNTSVVDWARLLGEGRGRFSPTQLLALEELHQQDTLQQAMAARIAQLIVPDPDASR
jgi:RNA polymerase sigma factor (sigma-70 family)